MKIGKSDAYLAPAVTGNALQGPRQAVPLEPSKTSEPAVDQVGLSEEARFMNQVKQTLRQGEEIRADKVEYYRDLIAKGQLKIDADRIASRMVDELF